MVICCGFFFLNLRWVVDHVIATMVVVEVEVAMAVARSNMFLW